MGEKVITFEKNDITVKNFSELGFNDNKYPIAYGEKNIYFMLHQNYILQNYAYIIERNEQCDYYLMKCEFELVFNDKQFCPYVTSELYSNKTMWYWYKFLEKLISDFKVKRYNFNHKAEMNTITIANKLDKSYDFYFKHIICALEWTLNAPINKNKNLIKKFNRNWNHPLNRKIESYRV